ncbi:hypothetical protein BTVI_146996 [Pitangus sulphuratus]|nr:hypothetical protein BTVI_146996 [Pitangus sulphuratus]
MLFRYNQPDFQERRSPPGCMGSQQERLELHLGEDQILHHHIASVEKLPLTTAGYPLLIHCKNFHVAHFVLGQERDCHDVFTSLLKLSQPVKPEELYAFSYNPKMSKENREIGWKLIDLKLDYQRMGIPNDYWEITDINKDYEVCSTYPPEIVVPRAASKAVVMGSSKFRSRGRIPVLSYLYKENNVAAQLGQAQCLPACFDESRNWAHSSQGLNEPLHVRDGLETVV